MILQNTKNETAGFSLMQLLGGSQDLDKGASFAQLLQQLGLDSEMLDMQQNSSDFSNLLLKDDSPIKLSGIDLKNLNSRDIDTLIASLETRSDKNIPVRQEILKLLQNSEAVIQSSELSQDDLQVLNPKLVEMLPLPDLKAIVADAKTYLKEQISELAKSKGIEIDIETLPKTLKSLSLVAEKIGVQLDKMTLETIQSKGATFEKTQMQTSVLQTQSKPIEHSTQEFVHLRKEQVPNLAASAMKETQEIAKNEPLKALLHIPVIDKKEVHKKEQKVQQQNGVKVASQSVKQIITDETLRSAVKVVSQSVKHEIKNVQMNTNTNFTGDTKEIQPVISKSSIESDSENTVKLSSLLYGEEASDIDSVEVKSDSKTASTTSIESKNLELDLKVKEAKQMVSRLAVDLKEAVENYKPPFTRIKLQLNPVKLGEVEVTMVQRGNNVHINISSNTSAITVLAQNAVELKTQLANNGLSNATMQFNTSGGEQQRQSQHQQNMMDMYEKYAEFENDEAFETLTSMELIIPRYV